MLKNASSGNSNCSWLIVDTARATYNAVNPYLLADTSEPEGNVDYLDSLSNGFKLRAIGDRINATGSTYIYAAFAEYPFATARAR